jgi:hypothetical protein
MVQPTSPALSFDLSTLLLQEQPQPTLSRPQEWSPRRVSRFVENGFLKSVWSCPRSLSVHYGAERFLPIAVYLEGQNRFLLKLQRVQFRRRKGRLHDFGLLAIYLTQKARVRAISVMGYSLYQSNTFSAVNLTAAHKQANVQICSMQYTSYTRRTLRLGAPLVNQSAPKPNVRSCYSDLTTHWPHGIVSETGLEATNLGV